MADVIPPNRTEPLVETRRQAPTRRAAAFFEDVATKVNGAPIEMTALPDLAPTATLLDVINAYNSLLTELRDSGRLEP